MATQETYDLTWDRGLASIPSGDRELTLSFQRGDEAAYNSIYVRYAPRVNAVCQRMLSDPQDAQDAAQETFLRVYQALPRFNGRYQLGAWINRIATNVCLDHLRARRRSPADAAPNEVLEDVIELDSGDGPEDVAMRSAEGTRVQETLATLTPIQRTAIVMRDFEGRDYSDIASKLGVSECRARVLLHRARKGFRKSWSSEWIILGLPARLLNRLRRVRGPFADQVAYAASSAANAGGTAVASGPFATCSQVIQQCGEMVSERITAVAAATIVGVTVASGAGAVGDVALTQALKRPAEAASATSRMVTSAITTVVQLTQDVVSDTDVLTPPLSGDEEADDGSMTPGEDTLGGGVITPPEQLPAENTPPEGSGTGIDVGGGIDTGVGTDLGTGTDPGVGTGTGTDTNPDTGGGAVGTTPIPTPEPAPEDPATPPDETGGTETPGEPTTEEPPGQVPEDGATTSENPPPPAEPT